MFSENRSRQSGGDDLASIQFRAFAAVLLQERAAAAGLTEADGCAGAVTLSHALCQLIELQEREAGNAGACLDAQLQARLLKAALADDLMLSLDWPGRAHWPRVLAAATPAQSGSAGEQVFSDIDQLLRARDPARRPLARLYMHLLALGFQGRYRGSGNLAPIAAYRRELFRFAGQRTPGKGGADAHDSLAPLRATSHWAATLTLAAIILLGVSEVLWLWQSASVLEEPGTPMMASNAPAPPPAGKP